MTAPAPALLAVAHRAGRTVVGRYLYGPRSDGPAISVADVLLLFLGVQSARQLITTPTEGP